MRAVVTVLVTWFNTADGGTIRAEWWRSVNGQPMDRMELVTMQGPCDTALHVGNSIVRRARESINFLAFAEVSERDGHWRWGRSRDGTLRYARTITYTTAIG